MGTITRSFANLITASGPSGLPALGTLTLNNIQFPSTAVTSANANNLDDYEEGTFTPTIKGTSTDGTGTYSNRHGHYTKIGDMCFINIFIQWSAHTGTGNMKLSDLPFTSLNQYQAAIPHTSEISFTGNIEMEVSPSSTDLYYYQNNSGSVTQISMDTSAFTMLTFGYKIS